VHPLSAAVTKRPRSAPGDPMTLGNMRANGVRSLAVSYWQCHPRAILQRRPLAREKMVGMGWPKRDRAYAGKNGFSVPVGDGQMTQNGTNIQYSPFGFDLTLRVDHQAGGRRPAR
jgi:hypothetical protein